MKIINNILVGTILLLVGLGCNSDEEFINPFTSDDGIAARGAFVRFEETPGVVADGEVAFDQLGSFTLTGELVDPAGNVQSYELLVALNPESNAVEEHSPLLTIDSFVEDVPVPLSVPIADIASALGIGVADISPDDEMSFQAVTTRDDGTTFGFDNLTNNIFSAGERQAMSFSIAVTDSRPVATYFTLASDPAGGVTLDGNTLSRQDVDVTPLTEGETRAVYVTFNSAVQTPPTLSVDTANGGTLSPLEQVTFTEAGSEVTAYRATFTAGSLADAEVDIAVSGAVETAAAGGETMGEDAFTIRVDNTAPVYTLSYSAPATDTALAVTVTAAFSEVIQGTPPPTISISGQGVVPVESQEMEVSDDQLVATYLFEPRGEGEVTEGPLTITINAADLAGNSAVVDPESPELVILR